MHSKSPRHIIYISWQRNDAMLHHITLRFCLAFKVFHSTSALVHFLTHSNIHQYVWQISKTHVCESHSYPQVDWFKDVADQLRPLYYRIRDLVIDTDYIQADETTVSIVDDEKHRTVKGYLWQICAVTQKLLFFHYDKGSRSKDVALGLFAHFRGALQTDGYAVDDYYEGKAGVLCLNCWAHTRRGFDRSINNDAARSKYAIEQIGLLYEVERKADDENLTCDERRDLRMRLAVPRSLYFRRLKYGSRTRLPRFFPRIR